MIRTWLIVLVLAMACVVPVSADEFTTVETNAVAPAQTSRSAALTFANLYAESRNRNYPDFSGGDCTNYVSQILGPDGAGNPMTSTWYAKRKYILRIPAGWEWTKSWSVVVDFLNQASKQGVTFAGFDNPKGKWSSGKGGDILSYQWSGRGPWNHLSFIVLTDGVDPKSGWKGTLVNQHTTDRKKAFWTLQPYNKDWQTTRIGRWQVKYTR